MPKMSFYRPENNTLYPNSAAINQLECATPLDKRLIRAAYAGEYLSFEDPGIALALSLLVANETLYWNEAERTQANGTYDRVDTFFSDTTWTRDLINYSEGTHDWMDAEVDYSTSVFYKAQSVQAFWRRTKEAWELPHSGCSLVNSKGLQPRLEGSNPIIFYKKTYEDDVLALDMHTLAFAALRADRQRVEREVNDPDNAFSFFQQSILGQRRSGVRSIDHVQHLMYRNAVIGVYDAPLSEIEALWQESHSAEDFYPPEFIRDRQRIPRRDYLRYLSQRRLGRRLWHEGVADSKVVLSE